MLKAEDIGYYRQQIEQAREIVAPFTDSTEHPTVTEREAMLIATVMIVEAITDLLNATRGS